jgi:hypothetical protein
MPFSARTFIGFRRLARSARMVIGSAIGSAIGMAMLAMPSSLPAAPASGEDDDWGNAPPAAAASLSPRLSRKVLALKEEANRFYRARKYPEACRLYREATLLDGNDAGLRNDLGICFQKSGKKDSALAATREALRLAGRSLAADPPADWSFPDLRARKNAYFNLDKLGGPMSEPRPGQCETWSSLSNCRGRLHVCVEAGSRPAEGGTLRWRAMRVGLTRARALFSYEEVEAPALVPRPEIRDMEELSIDGEAEGRSRWVNRDSSAVLPLGEALETADPACAGNCGRLERVQSECRVIHFDPCAGVLGVACGIQEGEGKDRIVISEFYLIPAR